MRRIPLLLVVWFLHTTATARADNGASAAVGHGDAGQLGDLVIRGGLGAGLLTGCCGSDPFYSANASLRAGLRVRPRVSVGLALDFRSYHADGSQKDAALLLQGQYWVWKRAYATLGAGVSHVVEAAGNGAGPMFDYDNGLTVAVGVGFEIPLHRAVALTLELTESLTRYGDSTYHTPSFTAGLTFMVR